MSGGGQSGEPDGPLFHVVLVEPEIPPNTGNAARLCAAARCRLHLVGPLGFRMDDAALRRAGMDYWRQVDWRYHDTFEAVMAQKAAEALVYCVETGEGEGYASVRYRPGDYLVFGRETKGLRRSVIECAGGRRVNIPMPGGAARSLNLSNAVAVVVYEALRQNGFDRKSVGLSPTDS